ncbi:21 kDa seed protein-like [Lycium ferocissimum]|uniref:21 kDa seed protein-like n=1 Tax=Lycium ferocissimum TaxID=112874 RepID=UPI002814C175|nr:21 kDa seed protein-like [Lycium ferocissimum]
MSSKRVVHIGREIMANLLYKFKVGKERIKHPKQLEVRISNPIRNQKTRMKIMLLLFSLAFLFTLTTSANDGPNQLSSVVRDTDGRPFKSNTRYFIHSACWGEYGRGLLLLTLGDQAQNRCPASVVQSLIDTYNGLGAYFEPKRSQTTGDSGILSVNIKFTTRGYLCANWTVLKVDRYPKPTHNYTIWENPLDENSWFQIKSLGVSAYKLVFCPHEVEKCIDTGLVDQHGYRRLALAEDAAYAWPFVFIKDDQYGKADE